MYGDNPVVIQQERLQASSVPLYLIHDGGGTINSYLSFGDLGRDLYGIYNPRFQDNKKWTGGITEMAREYVEIIKESTTSNKILLGGTLPFSFRSAMILRLCDSIHCGRMLTSRDTQDGHLEDSSL